MQQMFDHVRWPPDPWMVGEFPHRRSHSFGSASLPHVTTSVLTPHPQRPLFVSGSSSGHIYIWQFGDEQSKAAYIPITSQVPDGATNSTCFRAVDSKMRCTGVWCARIMLVLQFLCCVVTS